MITIALGLTALAAIFLSEVHRREAQRYKAKWELARTVINLNNLLAESRQALMIDGQPVLQKIKYK